MKVPGIDDDFVEQLDKIVDEANELLQVRGKNYNQGGVTLHDQYQGLPSSIDAYWSMVHIRFFRLKSMMQGTTSSLVFETLRDLLNEVRFLYAELKRQNDKPLGHNKIRVHLVDDSK